MAIVQPNHNYKQIKTRNTMGLISIFVVLPKRKVQIKMSECCSRMPVSLMLKVPNHLSSHWHNRGNRNKSKMNDSNKSTKDN